MPINRDFRKRKKNDPFRLKEIADNNWISKYLFTELPLDVPTQLSQLYILKREVRGDGINWEPSRVNIESIFDASLNIWSEGNAATEYLPSEIFDEGDSTATYAANEIYDESDSAASY